MFTFLKPSESRRIRDWIDNIEPPMAKLNMDPGARSTTINASKRTSAVSSSSHLFPTSRTKLSSPSMDLLRKSLNIQPRKRRTGKHVYDVDSSEEEDNPLPRAILTIPSKQPSKRKSTAPASSAPGLKRRKTASKPRKEASNPEATSIHPPLPTPESMKQQNILRHNNNVEVTQAPEVEHQHMDGGDAMEDEIVVGGALRSGTSATDETNVEETASVQPVRGEDKSKQGSRKVQEEAEQDGQKDVGGDDEGGVLDFYIKPGRTSAGKPYQVRRTYGSAEPAWTKLCTAAEDDSGTDHHRPGQTICLKMATEEDSGVAIVREARRGSNEKDGGYIWFYVVQWYYTREDAEGLFAKEGEHDKLRKLSSWPATRVLLSDNYDIVTHGNSTGNFSFAPGEADTEWLFALKDRVVKRLSTSQRARGRPRKTSRKE